MNDLEEATAFILAVAACGVTRARYPEPNVRGVKRRNFPRLSRLCLIKSSLDTCQMIIFYCTKNSSKFQTAEP
jgi:hypothetical protein